MTDHPIPPPPDPPGPFPRELRIVAALLVLDLVVGVWLALQRRQEIAVFFSQLTVLGAAGAAWGVMPETTKTRFNAWLAGVLRCSALLRTVVIATGAALIFSLTWSSVIVEASEPGVTAMVRVVPGRQLQADSTASRVSARRLNRLTTPVRALLFVPLWGRRVWLYTPSHVSITDVNVHPWFPSVLHYPDDFDSLVTIGFVPGPKVLSSLRAAPAHLIVLGMMSGADTVVTAPLGDSGLQVGFPRPGPMDSAALSRAREEFRQQRKAAQEPADSDVVEHQLGIWKGAATRPARRPIHRSEVLTYVIISADGARERGRGRITASTSWTPVLIERMEP